MFYDRTSEAFRWLTGLCAVYVSLCSLGLERSAESEIEARLREIDLLLDTDIVLSLLSPGEPLHIAITAVVNGWKRISGHVYITPAVLEETAYHAWISTRDYEQSWRELGTMTDTDTQRLLSNAFTRGFRIEAKGEFHPSRWGQYIDMFRGSSPYDYAKIVEILKDEHVFPVSEENLDSAVADEVAKAILAHWQADAPAGEGSDDKEAKDKAERDGRLIASLLKHRQSREKVGGTAVLVSSSGRLRTACDAIRSRLGDPEPVVPVGAIAYYLTMLPGVSLSFGTLREVLFDIGYAAQLSALDRMALRVLHASKEYVLPFSRRGSLRHAMRAEIGKLAKQQGRPAREVERDISHGRKEMVDDITAVVAASVDSLARSESEKRMERLEQQVRNRRGGK